MPSSSKPCATWPTISRRTRKSVSYTHLGAVGKAAFLQLDEELRDLRQVERGVEQLLRIGKDLSDRTEEEDFAVFEHKD